MILLRVVVVAPSKQYNVNVRHWGNESIVSTKKMTWNFISKRHKNNNTTIPHLSYERNCSNIENKTHHIHVQPLQTEAFTVYKCVLFFFIPPTLIHLIFKLFFCSCKIHQYFLQTEVRVIASKRPLLAYLVLLLKSQAISSLYSSSDFLHSHTNTHEQDTYALKVTILTEYNEHSMINRNDYRPFEENAFFFLRKLFTKPLSSLHTLHRWCLVVGDDENSIVVVVVVVVAVVAVLRRHFRRKSRKDTNEKIPHINLEY